MTSDFQHILTLLDNLGEGEGDMDYYLKPISEALRRNSQAVSELRDLFYTETQAGRKNDILMALSSFASDEIERAMQADGFDRNRCRYEFLLQGSLHDIWLPDIDRSHWQRLLDCLRYGDEEYNFTLDGETTALPEDAARLFSELAEQPPRLTVDAGATFCCNFITEGEIRLSLDPQQGFDMREIFDFMAYLGLLLDRPVRLTPRDRSEQPLYAYTPEENRFTSFPLNFQAPVGEGVATCPQLLARELRIDEQPRTWGDLLARLDWQVSLVIGKSLLFTEHITAAELACQLGQWLGKGQVGDEPFAFTSTNDRRRNLLCFCPDGDLWRIESCLLATDVAPTVTALQLQWCVETFIEQVFAATQQATGQRLSLVVKELVSMDETLGPNA
jgi:hypothetical protein